MESYTRVVHTIPELAELAAEVLTIATEKRRTDAATVIILSGDLGTGKTAFTAELGAKLGITEPITSPTFIIMKQYELTEQPWQQLVHMDAYRIEELAELTPLGFADVMADPANLVCIEWAEKITEALPEETLQVSFEIGKDQARTVRIS